MCMSPLQAASRILDICQDLLRETLRFLRLMINSKASLAAEVLFLRKQLAFYQERNIKPHRFNDAARLSMLVLAKLFDWKNALVNVSQRHSLAGIGKHSVCSGAGSREGEGRGCRRTFAD